MTRVAEVVAAGLHTTVQDLGRRGVARLGVPAAGALDGFAVRIANRLVGNGEGAAVLECTLRGPALRFAEAAVVAVVGGATGLTVDGRPAPTHTAVPVPRGGLVEVGRVTSGLRCWVAVGGGLAVPAVLGSRSVDTLTGLGGRPLAAGDRIPVGAACGPPAEGPAPAWPPAVGEPVTVRTLPGPHAGWFAASLAAAGYRVTPRSDRTGLRLSGEPLAAHRPAREVRSHGLVAGAVQVPPDGQPVVLLAGHQATGGYPVVAVVCAADVPLLAQARPGQAVRFEPVDLATARRLYAERVAALLG